MKNNTNEVYNNVPGCVLKILNNSSYTVVYANQQFYDFIGYTKEEFSLNFGNSLVKLLPKEDKEVLRLLQQKFPHDISFEVRVVCANNQIKWAFLSCNLIENQSNQYCGVLFDITEKKLYEKEYEIVNKEIQKILAVIPNGHIVCSLDDGLTIQEVSEGFFKLTKTDEDILKEQYHNRFTNFIYPHALEGLLKETIFECLEQGHASCHLQLSVHENQPLLVLLNCSYRGKESGSKAIAISIINIDYLQEYTEKNEVEKKRYEMFFSQSQDIIFEWNCESNAIVYCDNFERKFGYSPDIILQPNFVYPEDQEKYLNYLNTIRTGNADIPFEGRIMKKDGSYIWCQISVQFICRNNDAVHKIVGMISDIDKQKRKVLKAQELAKKDALTGLYNHGATEELISDYLKESKEYAALMVIDVDNFKAVNDCHGHIFGDAVLAEIAYRLKTLFRKNDIIGRFGGDEFVVFLSEIEEAFDIVRSAKEVLNIFRTSFFDQDLSTPITASIGIAKYPQDGVTYKDLFQRADKALYFAKRKGKNTHAIYNQSVENMTFVAKEFAISARNRTSIKKPYRDNLGEYIFRLFYESPNVEDAIPALLELVGKSVNSSRVYIFEFQENERYFLNTYEWCSQGIEPMKNQNPVLGYYEDLENEEWNDSGDLYVCDNVSTISSPRIRQWLIDRNVKATMVCRVYDEEKVAALVGFEQCNRTRTSMQQERDTLEILSKMISLFLIKKRKNESLKLYKGMTKQLLDQLNAFIYVVDPATYKILYFDHNGSSHIDTCACGEVCYHVFRNETKPCEDCPIYGLTPEHNTFTTHIYNQDIDMWTENNASLVQWKDGKDVCLITSIDITKYKKQTIAKVEQALEAFKGALDAYFTQHDAERFLSYLCEDIQCVGLGGQEVTFGKEQMRQRIKSQISTKPSDYHFTLQNVKATANSENSVEIFAQIKLEWQNAEGEKRQVVLRQTATLVKQNFEFLITSLHSSIASFAQNLQEILSTQIEEKTKEQLYEEERIRNYHFLDSCVPGGMMSVFLEKDFPLVFINESMLRYLGYQDQEDFLNATSGLLINCVHEEDREYVQRTIEQMLGQNTTYEITYRMLKKDGSFLWFCERGKRQESIHGRETILSVCLDITSTKLAQQELVENNVRFNVVVNQTNICVCDYNVKEKTIVHISSSQNRYGLSVGNMSNVPQCLLESSRIHNESKAVLKDIFNRIEAGEEVIQAEICFWNKNDQCWCWELVTFRTFLDEDGIPQKAIGIGQDITKQKEAEIKYQKELQIRNSLSEGVVGTCKVNITQNTLEYVESVDKQDEVDKLSSYDELLNFILKYVVNTEERKKMCSMFKRSNMPTLCTENDRTITMEYRRRDKKGNIIWVSGNVSIWRDEKTKDLVASAIIRDINESKNLELSLKQRVEKDSITNAYNRETTILIVSDAMKKTKVRGRNNLMLILNIDNYKEILLKSGDKATNKMLFEINQILESKFGKYSIIGRMYSDSFAMLIGGQLIQWIEETAKEVIQIIKTPYFFPDLALPLSVSVGIAEQIGHDESFENLYQKAVLAARIAGVNDRNSCMVYRQEMDSVENFTVQCGTALATKGKGMHQEETILLSCAVAMLSLEACEQGINEALKEVAQYYCAHHLFVVEYSKKCESITDIYEWVKEDDKCNIKNFNFSYLKSIFDRWLPKLQAKGCIICSTKKEVEVLYQNSSLYANDYIFDNMIAIPLNFAGEIVGFICAEGLHYSVEDYSLLSWFSAFLSEKIHKKQMEYALEYTKTHDHLTGLLNRESFLDYRITIAEDVLSSLGVAVVNINGLRKINNQFGLQYGDNIIRFIAKKLKIYFGGSYLYRYGGDEFLIISQNTTKLAFERKCRRFDSDVSQTLGMGTSIGIVWADSEINIDNMLKHAQEQMMISKMAYYKENKSLNGHHNPSMLKAIFTAINQKEFKLYLQPKADVITQEVVGAEALVRLYKEKKGIIYPDKFIPQMEEDGTIKYLDLYMFEEVCKTQMNWIDSGKSPIPISLNFSRSTLLTPDLIDSMGLIYEKYRVPKQLIEIEITESFGEMEKDTVVQIARKIVDMGFRLSLDDFGSKYSNISILSAIKLDALKLDKSIVNDLFSNNNTKIIVKSFLCICKELGIESVAEGVETLEQLEILREFGCDIAQGYYFNKPIPLQDFEEKYLDCALV